MDTPTTAFAMLGLATAIPPTAEVTETAGLATVSASAHNRSLPASR